MIVYFAPSVSYVGACLRKAVTHSHPRILLSVSRLRAVLRQRFPSFPFFIQIQSNLLFKRATSIALKASKGWQNRAATSSGIPAAFFRMCVGCVAGHGDCVQGNTISEPRGKTVLFKATCSENLSRTKQRVAIFCCTRYPVT